MQPTDFLGFLFSLQMMGLPNPRNQKMTLTLSLAKQSLLPCQLHKTKHKQSTSEPVMTHFLTSPN